MDSLSRTLRWIACGGSLCAFTACGIPLSTLHGPVPLPANTSTATVGLGPIFLEGPVDEDLLLFATVFGAYAGVRQGVNERLEVGASAGIFNGISVDAKYNLVQGPIHVSADLTVSGGLVLDLWGDDDTDVLGVHPALIVGTERVYGGAKLMMFPSNPSLQPWQVVFAGGSFGRRRQIVSEIAWLRDPADGETAWIGGLALRVPATPRRWW